MWISGVGGVLILGTRTGRELIHLTDQSIRWVVTQLSVLVGQGVITVPGAATIAARPKGGWTILIGHVPLGTPMDQIQVDLHILVLPPTNQLPAA